MGSRVISLVVFPVAFAVLSFISFVATFFVTPSVTALITFASPILPPFGAREKKTDQRLINAHPSYTHRRLFSFLPPFQLFECDLKAWISENFRFHSQNKYKTIDLDSII